MCLATLSWFATKNILNSCSKENKELVFLSFVNAFKSAARVWITFAYLSWTICAGLGISISQFSGGGFLLFFSLLVDWHYTIRGLGAFCWLRREIFCHNSWWLNLERVTIQRKKTTFVVWFLVPNIYLSASLGSFCWGCDDSDPEVCLS